MASKNPFSPEGVACFVNLFKPVQRKNKKGEPEGDPQYGMVLVFDKKADLSEMEEIIEQAAVDKFGSKAISMLQNGKLINPLRDGEEYEKHGKPFTNRGARFANFKKYDTNGRPGIVDADGDPIIDSKEIYSGCIMRCTYRAVAYDNRSQGVNLYLVNAQKLDDGERLSGDPSAEDEFGSGASRRSSSSARRSSRDDDEDDKPARSSRRPASRDDDEDDRPARRPSSRRSRDDDDDDMI